MDKLKYVRQTGEVIGSVPSLRKQYMTIEAVDLSEPLICHDCFRRVSELFEVTPEDEMRSHSGGARVCARCLDRIRSAARLESRYTGRQTLLDLIVLTLVLYFGLSVVSYSVSGIWITSSLGSLSVAFFAEVVAILTGGNIVLKWLRWRYSYTHNLLWSLKTRPVILGFSVMIAASLVMAHPV